MKLAMYVWFFERLPKSPPCCRRYSGNSSSKRVRGTSDRSAPPNQFPDTAAFFAGNPVQLPRWKLPGGLGAHFYGMGVIGTSGLPRCALPVSASWLDSTTLVVPVVVCPVLISSVMFFSPFLPLFSRRAKSERGLLARPRAAFSGGPRNFVIGCFSWGDRRAGGCRRGDKAKVGGAASAQGLSPSRRAREKKRC